MSTTNTPQESKDETPAPGEGFSFGGGSTGRTTGGFSFGGGEPTPVSFPSLATANGGGSTGRSMDGFDGFTFGRKPTSASKDLTTEAPEESKDEAPAAASSESTESFFLYKTLTKQGAVVSIKVEEGMEIALDFPSDFDPNFVVENYVGDKAKVSKNVPSKLFPSLVIKIENVVEGVVEITQNFLLDFKPSETFTFHIEKKENGRVDITQNFSTSDDHSAGDTKVSSGGDESTGGSCLGSTVVIIKNVV